MSETPRQKFVEAMRVLVKLPGYLNAKRTAVEAFADAECEGGGHITALAEAQSRRN